MIERKINVKRRNIEISPKVVTYNAKRKFKGNIIKIPSYIVDDVFAGKKEIKIYHNNEYLVTYTYDNLFSYISRIEDKEYPGKFRLKDITYKLAHIQV